MSNNLTADARVPGEARGDWWRPLSSLYRDIGLATVATELNLQPDTLEPDVAEAVRHVRNASFLGHEALCETRSWLRRIRPENL